jgi:uncharacterized protein (DUF983 family)
MTGGSIEREASNDRQCRHCGRWYAFNGLHNHEPTCDLNGLDARVVPIEDAYTLSRIKSDGSGVETAD